MSSKQDAVAARTAADIERKYNFGKSFAEVMGLANDAQDAADRANDAAQKAEAAVGNLDEALTQEEIFNRLTKDGTMKGLYMENGELYINASYIMTGEFRADLIKAGIIKPTSGLTEFDLDNGSLILKSNENFAYVKIGNGNFDLCTPEGNSVLKLWNLLFGGAISFLKPSTGEYLGTLQGTNTGITLNLNGEGHKLQWKDNGDGTYSLIGV